MIFFWTGICLLSFYNFYINVFFFCLFHVNITYRMFDGKIVNAFDDDDAIDGWYFELKFVSTHTISKSPSSSSSFVWIKNLHFFEKINHHRYRTNDFYFEKFFLSRTFFWTAWISNSVLTFLFHNFFILQKEKKNENLWIISCR